LLFFAVSRCFFGVTAGHGFGAGGQDIHNWNVIINVSLCQFNKRVKTATGNAIPLILGLDDPFDPPSWKTGAQGAEAVCLTRINRDVPTRADQIF
jgi:hypothetical protein